MYCFLQQFLFQENLALYKEQIPAIKQKLRKFENLLQCLNIKKLKFVHKKCKRRTINYGRKKEHLKFHPNKHE